MLEEIFAPQSVAVVGASPEPSRLGHRVLKNVVDNGYLGRIYPIHPTAEAVLGHKAYPSVLAIPDPVELAVLVIPPQFVLAVAEECGQKGVKGLVVITAGFKEVGGEGTKLEQQLVATMRIL
jgi:acetyltransferase